MSNLSDWDLYFLRLAHTVKGKSRDPSTRVGSVIVDPKKRPVATGFNGFPSKFKDDPELYLDRDTKYSRIIHGEMNAILFAHRDLTGCTLYTYPFMSCSNCAKHVIQAGITRHVAPTPPRDQARRWDKILAESMKFFDEAKVQVDLIQWEEWRDYMKEYLLQEIRELDES